MNIILDPLPYTVEVAGEEVEINWDFRAMMLFELAMQDPTLDYVEKAQAGLELFFTYDDYASFSQEDFAEASKALIWFYSGGKDHKPKQNDAEPAKREAIYSFEHDADLIYAAFLSQYKIDLSKVGDLHWWAFQALFKSLNEDHLISKVMTYRSIKITPSMSNEDKKFYKKMKSLYRLPDMRSQEEKEEAFNEEVGSLF